MPRLTSQQQDARRAHILAAAGRCFTRDGFHRTSIQAICREAGVSPGGLYVHFPSKEALIAGLIEADRAELATAFASAAASPDVLTAMIAVGRRYFVEEPPGKAALTLQIWAESARDPAIRDRCLGIEQDVRAHLLFLCQTLRGQGRVASGVRIEALVDLLMLISDGIFKSRALDPRFDGENALAGMLGVFAAGLAGHLDPTTTASSPEPVA